MKISLTPVQAIALVLVILGAVTGGTAQLDVIVGAALTKVIVAFASLSTTILSGWIMILTGQSGQLKAVQAMPGIESITVNAQANPTLAKMAVDQTQDKIEATPQAAAAVAATARAS